MTDATRIEVADSLDRLANIEDWDKEVWRRCYDLVSANLDDELLAYVHDDLVHCTGVRFFDSIFKKNPKPPDFRSYQAEFGELATALRSGMLLKQFKRDFGR